MQHTAEKRSIVETGERLGFLDMRATRIEPLDREAFYEQWLHDGRAGDMRFLLHHKKARLDPRTRYPWARTMVSAFFPYEAPPPPDVNWREELRGRIAAYVLGPDYHDVIGERLERWAEAVRDAFPGTQVKAFVDTGAVFEHEWAARAGVGWTGKHTLTLSESRGSYAFLGELLIEAALEPDPPVADRCGTCTRCIDACPTDAIEPGFRLEPRRCISYLTIEHRGVLPRELRSGLGPWVFGCDICQMVCPWNDDAVSVPRDVLAPRLADLLGLDNGGFEALYGGSAVRRAGRIGLARNAAVVLGNTRNPGAVPPLAAALATHDAPLVRVHAAGALAALRDVAGTSVGRALEAARRDPDDDVRREVEAGLTGRTEGT
ncbi:MAG: tRNA epoxyqueuosine(34) reductase QueG [Candidatus Binatia bacterium]|nr:tRNA epoxyqueuosine(34) reductase QueG [Candidatus Binatia bacterium]